MVSAPIPTQQQDQSSYPDGPYDYEGDVASDLGDSKGTFFLNVRRIAPAPP